MASNRKSRPNSKSAKWFLAGALATSMLLSCHASHAAQKTIEWSDDMCTYKAKFDPKKYDEQILRNTAEVLFIGTQFEDVSPNIPRHPASPADLRIERFRQLCESTRRQISDLALIDLPGIEAYRKLKLEELEDGCRFGIIHIRAAAGDAAALRSYAPSAAKCSRFIDALEDKVDIKTVWREMVNSRCQSFASPGMCRAEHFSDEGKPDATDRIRYSVLEFGWNNCSTAYLKGADRKQSEKMRSALIREFNLRFKMERPACSD
jgi:hypothetical protein